MKQAILITAHRDFEQLIDLIKMFDENFNIYIHIDKKSKLNKDTREEILRLSNMKYLTSKYKVNWVGLNHLRAIILLSKRALTDSENVFFHLITGQDYPIKTNQYLRDFVLKKSNLNYLEYFKMPASCWKNGGMDRLHYYNTYDLFDAKNSWNRILIYRIQGIQRRLNLKRSIDFSQELYGGSTYWSLSKSTLQYVINYTNQNPLFFKRFRYTFCAEEIYFQTIIMNSEYANHVINDNFTIH